ncbi:MAG: cytochrome c oxidase subunit II [Alphaproteobacteria bacterium]|nr:cytochrome c oxidase subunit II [Alphaproteobacteria bacterium]
MIGTYLRHAGIACAAFSASLLGTLASAFAEGRSVPWQMGFQPAATPSMERIASFHDLLLVIIIAITIFVTGLLAYVLVRFRASANPTPSKTTHNTFVEIAWTIVPIMILVLIAVFSFPLLYFIDRVPEAEAREKGAPVITVKATGSQFQWNYEYFKANAAGTGFKFDSTLLCRTKAECEDAKESNGGKTPLRLLDVDNRMVVPVGAYVRLQVTATDVIHSFAVPAFGVKLDAVPGRLNETWFRVKREGVYYGMCSELCGAGHGYMPIAVEVMSKEKYDAWIAKALTNDEFEKVKAAAEK